MPEGEQWVECRFKLNTRNKTQAGQEMENYRLLHLHFYTDLSPQQQRRTCRVELCALCQQWAGLWQNEEAVCADTIDALCSNTLEADRFLVMYLLM